MEQRREDRRQEQHFWGLVLAGVMGRPGGLSGVLAGASLHGIGAAQPVSRDPPAPAVIGLE